MEKRFVNLLKERAENNSMKDSREQEKKLIKAERRIIELDKIIKRLYEDNIIGKLTDERFIQSSKEYESKQQELKIFVQNTSQILGEKKEPKQNISKFMKVIKEFSHLEKLTPLIVNTLIERIEIHESDRHCRKPQQIDIYYNFVGALDDLDLKA